MNLQPTEQPIRPRRPGSNQHDAVSPSTSSRLMVVEQRPLPIGAALPRSTQSVAEHLASAPSARRVSMVESVAIQILSGVIELDTSGRKGPGAGQGISQHRWPLMLTRSELCEYLGASWRTLKNVLTVRPVDMGANIVRYNREEIDSWAASRPSKGADLANQAVLPDEPEPAVDTAAAALARARERGGKR